MPTAIDEEKFVSQETLDLSKPQGTTHGLPVRQIAHQEYSRAVYKHPNAPFFVEEHRNVNHEIVHREVKSAEHRVHVCHNKAEHQRKLEEGWKNEPYIQLAPPDPMDDLYGEVIAEDIARKGGKKGGKNVGKPDANVQFDFVAAQKLLLSRGYTCATPEDAIVFFGKLSPEDQSSFLANLANGDK